MLESPSPPAEIAKLGEREIEYLKVPGSIPCFGIHSDSGGWYFFG